jgi:predicted DsbA family dithiol-disulfide isomerase
MTTHHPAVQPKPTLPLEVVSDYICPWCYIGKARLRKALDQLGDTYPVALTFSPFQLNPQMPAEGLDRKAYRTTKFGSWEKSLAMDAAVVAAGQSEGLAFHYDKVLRTPNTFLAHRLTWYAGRSGKQEAVATALFEAYFSEGLDIGDRDILASVAAACGLDRQLVTAFLVSNQGETAIHQLEQLNRARGIVSVPVLVMNRKGIAGAQPVEVFRGFILGQVNGYSHE